MSTRDTTSNTYTKITRGRNLLIFHTNNRSLPLEGPRDNTLSSTYTDMLMGISPPLPEPTQILEASPLPTENIPVEEEKPLIDPDEPLPEPAPIIPSSAEGIYVTGSFNNNLTIFNSDGNIALTLPRVSTVGNTYIVKYNRSGIVQWATRNQGLNTRGEGIATDYEGNVYVMSKDSISSTFNIYNQGFTAIGQTPAITITKSSLPSTILVKYNIDGIAQWATKIEGSTSTSNILHLDKEKNIYIIGTYGSSNLIFYDAPTMASSIPSINSTTTGTTRTFIVKYNNLGVAQWATNIKENENLLYIPPTGRINVNPIGISTDSETNIYISGYYTINIEFNNSPGDTPSEPPTILVPLGNFIAKYNKSGNLIWKTKITGSNDISLDRYQGSLITDRAGNIYAAGYYADGILNFYNSDDTISTPSLLTTGEYNMYLVKYNKNGFVKWTNRVLGAQPSSISLDLNFNLYVLGRSITNLGVVLFNPDTSINKSLYLQNGDKFIIKYNSKGIPQWIALIKNIAHLYSCSTDFLGNIYIKCANGSAQFFNKDSNTPAISFPNYNGGFLAKYTTDGYVEFVSKLGPVVTNAVGYSVAAL